MRFKSGPFLFGVLIVFSVTTIASDAPATEPQKVVLALYGSRPDLPANIIVDEIIRSTLERELGPRLDFYAEYLDTARWPEAETQSAVSDFLRRRYAHKKPSAIIAVAQPAISFMRIYGDELFPGVPIVAYGDLNALRDWPPSRPITGALGKVDISKTVGLILRLQPQTRQILVISGASESDQRLRSIARPQLDPFEKRVKFIYLTGVGVEDLVSTVARLPDGTVILFLSMFQDAAGNKLLSHEMLSRIAREARVPVYNQTVTNVGLGIVGGVVFDVASVGRETAQLTLRVLRGERLQDLAVHEMSGVPMVDWRQLKRWGLDEKRLPTETVVRFREVSVWQSYKWYIVGSISLIMLQAVLITALLWHRARRRKAENELRESEQRFRLVANTAPVMIWMSGTDKLCSYVNQAWLDLTGRKFAAEMGSGWVESIHPEDLKASFDAYSQAFDRREPFTMQFRVRRHDGEYRWVLDRGVPRFNDDHSFAGYTGSCVDITDRKLAEESLSGVNRKLIEAQEQERTRIARELHDDINQRIALVGIEADLVRQTLPDSAIQLRNQMNELQSHLNDVGAEVQAISHRLHSSKLEYLGLVVACKSFCNEIAEHHGVTVTFTDENIPPSIPKELSLCLFRVLQESLNNAIKYSGAVRFEAHLRGISGEIQLTVRDHGIGFDAAAAMASRGLGLISMRERVSLVKGTLLIASRPGSGTEISARVPVMTTAVAQAALGVA